jgi:hypothetical protein
MSRETFWVYKRRGGEREVDNYLQILWTIAVSPRPLPLYTKKGFQAAPDVLCGLHAGSVRRAGPMPHVRAVDRRPFPAPALALDLDPAPGPGLGLAPWRCALRSG